LVTGTLGACSRPSSSSSPTRPAWPVPAGP